MRSVRVIDSHTEGEPTRVVISGGPAMHAEDLPGMVVELERSHPEFRPSIVCEPRGHDAIVGALIVPAVSAVAAAGVIFFNNEGYLGMCGHGTIGVVRTLAHLGRIGEGGIHLDTPAGLVGAALLPDGKVAVRNVPSYRYRADVSVAVPGLGEVAGDIAFGGNWFFLTQANGRDLSLSNLDELNRDSIAIRNALDKQKIRGRDGARIDHVEFFGPAHDVANGSRNFVLCPGLAYDRSPCGTGTSAKLACLAAEGSLAPGAIWRQESVIGSVFEGSYQWSGEQILPTIVGRAFITGEATLVFEDSDPFRNGLSLARLG